MTPLELLIAAAKTTVATQAAAKSATAKVKSAKTAAARTDAQLEADRLYTALDWRPRASVLMFDRWACACGTAGDAPQGLFVYLEHGRLANTTRLIAVRLGDTSHNALPRRIKYIARQVAQCHDCMDQFGFHRVVAPEIPHPAQAGFFATQWAALRRPTESNS